MLPVTSAHGPGAREERQAVAVLGPVAVLSDAGPVAPRGTRAAALVALLALASPRAVTASALIDALWADDLPANPRAALQNLVSRLRSLGPDVVRSTPAGYALGGPSDLDRARAAASRARELLENGRANGLRDGGSYDPAADAAALLDAALALWRGEPGDGLDDAAPGITAELQEAAGRLRDELTALRRRAAIAVGDHATVTALGAEALAANPLDEDAARDLMTALAASGRPDEAVRVFGRLRHALVAELGADPAPDLVALHARIARAADRVDGATPDTGDTQMRGVRAAEADDAAAGRPGARRFVRGLRAAATPLIGREDDVRAVVGELARHRVVTILGAGGLGKTRLGQEVARTVAADPAGTTSGPLGGLSIAVAELAGVRTDDDVALAIADGLGVTSAAGSARLADRLLAGDLRDRIVERARTARTLLLLDNCEHVPDGAARWADTLLSAAPGLRILATSRAPLQVAAEQVYPLAPLASGHVGAPGGARGPAVELFRQRALAARPGAQLPDVVVARLCDRLDGLPLAIELAAARVRTLSVEEIERHLDARFALLRGGDRTVPDRHRTLEAVIEWSWNLLEPSQRELWRRVSVLPDGLSAQAAAALGRLGDVGAGLGAGPGGVAEADPGGTTPLDVLDDIDGLVTQSLLVVEEDNAAQAADPAGGPTRPAAPVRYRMLETVREFGLLRLTEAGEDDAVRDALLDWAKGLSRYCTARMLGPGQVAAVAELRREHENLLFALRTAGRTGRPDVVVHGYVALGGAWTLRGAEERAADLAPAVLDAVTGRAVPPGEADVTALALAYASATTAFSGSTANLRALARLRRVLRDHGDAVSYRTRAVASMLLAPTPETVARLAGSADPLVAFLTHLAASQEAENAGRLDEALADAERAYDLSHDIGDVACPAGAAMFLAGVASEAGDTLTAARWSGIARGGLAALAADGALRQLDWVDLAAALDVDDLAEADRICERLDRAGSNADEADRGGVESRAVAGAGRAEIAYARGDVAEALARYEEAVGAFAGVPGVRAGDGVGQGYDVGVWAAAEPGADPDPAAPWEVILGAAWAVRLVGAGQDVRAGRVADVVRRRAVHMYREWMRNIADHPVLGTVCLGLAVVLALGEPRSGVGRPGPDRGLELLALAEVLGSRQDLRALRREPVFAAAAERFGAAAVADARAGAAAIDRGLLAEHVLTTLERLEL
ncbi:putative ATPase [Promicromonospora sp. AC04]|uniref:AfsR/SARP family transcriptional regulator n=1 Tax=Promicromonospora sp. AC04 TaxID=2135723 RepID=UPI000D3BFBFF|nr:BTAD domain-containing putative transcriptional regulator [Promicromonospora sp. AC04]PUB20931.1 putative ATPase [Promicromonospora sp. AC04]